MEHEAANQVFLEIRNRPYAWSTVPDQPANNCYFKGIELLQRLGVLGYAVRGRVGETYLDSKVPKEISELYPQEFLLTHFWTEVLLEDTWQILDPSYDPGLTSAGFVVNEWGSNTTCFDIIRAYSQAEALEYQKEWADPEYAKRYFEAIAPCAAALNSWLKEIREEG